jgi:hypothetical protein
VKNKKSNELKTYTYETVVIPDADNKKHKIFKSKFLAECDKKDEKKDEKDAVKEEKDEEIEEVKREEKTEDPCADVHAQLAEIYAQRRIEEDKLIKKFLEDNGFGDNPFIKTFASGNEYSII